MQKYWIHEFNILLRSLCFVSLFPVTFYSRLQVFHTDPALLYPILPGVIPLIAWYFVDSAYERSKYSTNSQLDSSLEKVWGQLHENTTSYIEVV